MSSDNISSLVNQTTIAAPLGNTPFYAALNVLFCGKILIATGVILEALTLVVFLHPKMNEAKSGSNMNTYLLAKTVCDMYYFLYFVFSQNVMCSSCSGIYARGWQYVLIITGYFYSMATCLSITFEFLATFDRYVFISKRFKIYQKVNHKIVIGVLFLLAMVVFVPKFFYNSILTHEVKTDAGNVTVYSYTFSDFYFTPAIRAYAFLISIYRDGIILAAIMIANVFVLIEMRKAFMRKRNVAGGSQAQAAKMERAERNLSLMIVFSGLWIIMGHILYFVLHLPLPTKILTMMSYNLYHFLAVFFAHVHLQCAFFLYLGFNNVFRETLIEIMGMFVPKKKVSELVTTNSYV